MKSRTIILMLLAAVILPTSLVQAKFWDLFGGAGSAEQKGAKAEPFHDVLDTPAVKSSRAAQSLLVGVTLAGNRIVCVGQHGHIVYSDNQGKSWTQASVPVSSDLLAVSFPTPKQGWVVGHDGVVLHTTDGGATWVKQFDGRIAAQTMMQYYTGPAAKSPPSADFLAELQKFVDQGPDKPFLDVWFESETTGYIVGAFNLIFRTEDGGKSWTPWYDRVDNPKRFHLYAIHPVGKDLFITSEQGTIFKLDPGKGRFKEIKTSYTGTFFGITGKPGAVIAFGMRGNAYRSRDGGSSWQKVETDVPSGLMGSAVTPDGKIVLVSQGGHLIVSSDDGASFTHARVDQPTPEAAVAALDSGLLALVGPRGVKVQALK